MMRGMKLRPDEYIGTRLRALSARLTRPHAEGRVLIINTMHCALQLCPGGLVDFAIDSHGVAIAVQEYVRNHLLHVTGVKHNDDSLHLDKDSNWITRQPFKNTIKHL
jgi:hypothetical protein